MGNRITKIKFHSIMRSIKAVEAEHPHMPRKAIIIASTHHVSRETVNSIQRAKTWPGFLLNKQARAVHINAAKLSKFEKAQKLGLHPVKRESTPSSKTATSKVSTERTVTYEEFLNVVRGLRARIERLEDSAGQSSRRGFFGQVFKGPK
jgi:hypothetical protein